MKIFTPFRTRVIFFIVCTLTIVSVLAQNNNPQHKKDSLGNIKINTLTDCSNDGNYEKVIELAPEYLSFMAKNELWTRYYEVYSIFIRAYLKINDTQNAIEKTQQMYDEAKQRNHDDGKSLALHQMGSIYLQMNRWEEAESYLTEAVDLLKTNDALIVHTLDAYVNLIDVLTLLYKTDEAYTRAQEFEKLIDRFYAHKPDAEKYKNLWIVYRDLYFAAGDYDKTEFYCEKISSTTDWSYGNSFRLAQIYALRGQYEKALEIAEEMIERKKDDEYYLPECLDLKIWVLCEKHDVADIYEMFLELFEMHNAFLDKELKVQLDKIRTEYEVDKHIAEKVRNRNYFLFALGGCVLLLIALGIWIDMNRKIRRKNRTLAQQIKALTVKQEEQVNEIIEKTFFVPKEEAPETVADDEVSIDSRLDKLCLAIRDLILKDKIYRNPALTQELVIETLGSNRRVFSEAFEYCFKMPFKDYINFLRMKDAVLLLDKSDLTIEEIADAAGFGTVRTLQRQFSAKYNMSPKEYRGVVK